MFGKIRNYRINPLFRENLKVALQSIKSNKARSIITIAIIAFGIMALVGILTAIEAIKVTFNRQFAIMGANTFTITSLEKKVQQGNRHSRVRNLDFISYREAERFKGEFQFPAIVSININASGTATLKYEGTKSNPNITVLGGDENFLATAGYELDRGRNFTTQDIEYSRNFVVLGSQLKSILFKNNEDPIGRVVTIGNGRYKVIGLLKEKGSSFSGAGDRMCVLPYTNTRQYFARPRMNYKVTVLPLDSKLMEAALSDAEGLFRQIRNLSIEETSDFEIKRSDNLFNMVVENMKNLTIAATIIGIITLLGAAIGLMNIMLVSVTERTSEIGTRKALGAKAKTVKQQFLFEAIVIGQIGGICGIILGMLIGNLVSMATGSDFIVPWKWLMFGVVLCFVVGVVSGYLPALKAAKLDPIEALRYE
ncbi:MAG TPA: ABC transporter permease [Bacteroidales bacterium]|nr:ABC transporter permease [Bacteroidales bacterium]